MSAQHTAGPWRWELNEATRTLHLVGGKPQFDLTIIEPVRWGMGSATLMIRDTAFDGMNIMHKLHERRDWIRAFPGRDHHVRWCTGVSHPDMLLIEAAPDLLAAAVDAHAFHKAEGDRAEHAGNQPAAVKLHRFLASQLSAAIGKAAGSAA